MGVAAAYFLIYLFEKYQAMNLLIIRRIRLVSMIALFFVIAVAYWSGWRDKGIDRENYLLMFSGIVESEDIAIKFYFAKDVFFLLLVSFTSIFSDDPKIAFLILCFISLITKFFAINRLAPKYTFIFLVLYVVFLAPGLEFAAMRGALGIGFLMLAIAYNNRPAPRTLFLLLAVASHMTMILAIVLFHRPVREFLTKHQIVFFAIALITYLSGSLLLTIIPSGEIYIDNKGTWLAYLLPLATLLLSFMIFFNLEKISTGRADDPGYHFLYLIRPVIYGLIAIAFGISSTVVVASTRYLEVAWCLLLVSSVMLFKKSSLNLLGFLLLLALFSYLNVYRFTWLAILDPASGGSAAQVIN